jgi:hypothetical protein
MNVCFNLLIGNHYFPPDCKATTIDTYLQSLEQNLNAHQYRVIMFRDFNVPNYNWTNGEPLPNSYYYNEIKVNSIHTTTCFLGLEQCNSSILNEALLDLVFSNVSDLSVSSSCFAVVTPDKYHPPLNLDLELIFYVRHIPLSPQRNFAQGDYLLLYNVLSQVNWSCILNDNSVDSAVNNLTDIVREAINLAVPYKRRKNTAYPHWFSKSLKYYIKKKKINTLEGTRNQNPLRIIVSFLIIANWSK